MVGYLLDASSLLNIVRRLGKEALSVLRGSSILDLTVYEVGNGIWSLVYLHKEIDYAGGVRLMKALARMFTQLNVLGLGEKLLEAYDVAIKEDLTFYDASYIIAAQSAGLRLVSHDAKLAEKAKKYVSVISSMNLKG